MGISYYFMSDLERQLMQLYEKEKSRRTILSTGIETASGGKAGDPPTGERKVLFL